MFKNIIIIILIISICYISIQSNNRFNIHSKWVSRELKQLNLDVGYLANTTFRKPECTAQGSMLALPDGSAYIPIIFNDKNNLKEHKSDIQWNEDEFPEGYYDFNKIFITHPKQP